MSAAAQGEVLHSNDSKSLWNYTLSPGWTEREVEVFRIALMKFGLGRWTKIVESRCLPGKTVAQLNNQAQRLIGQQSTSEFTGLHIDPSKVFASNQSKQGVRKNGCLINTDNNPTAEEIKKKRDSNKAKYGLAQEEIDALVIPVLKQEETSTVVIKSTLSLKDTANRRRMQFDRMRDLQANLQKLQVALELVEAGKGETPEDPKLKAKGKKQAQPDTSKQSKQSKKNESNKKKKKPTAKKTPQKKATATKKSSTTTKKSRKRVAKSQEELDSDLARRLQMEEGGREFMDDDGQSEDSDDDDFVVTSRGRRCKRNKRFKY